MNRMSIIAAAVVMAVTPPASVGGAIIGATEITQLLNNFELVGISMQEATQITKQVEMIANQARQISNELNMISNMVDNTRTVPGHVWEDAMRSLTDLASIVQTGDAIAYSMGSIDTAFAARFKDYSAYRASSYGPTDFYTDYDTWYKTRRDGIQGALKSANRQYSDFASEEAVIAQLQTMSETSGGRMQAIQVGNQIAAQQVRQTQKLRELVMAQTQAQSGYLAAKSAEEAANQARAQRFFNRPDGTVVGDEIRYDHSNMF